jgi:hypothetical protein
MIEDAGGDDDSINEVSALERIDQYMDICGQNEDTIVGELLAEVSAGSDVKYDLVGSKHGKDAEFRKVDNIIYYILSEKEKIGSE